MYTQKLFLNAQETMRKLWQDFVNLREDKSSLALSNYLEASM